MSAAFIDHHRRIITWIASILLLAIVMINSWWLFQRLTVPHPTAPENPILSLPNGELLASGNDDSASSGFELLPLVVSVGGMLLFGGALALFNMTMIKRAEQRDARRRQDLQAIAEAFEAYYDSYGHYPLSSSYAEGYYRAIVITNEWRHYDLPAAEVMKTYLPQWPISDPSIPLNDKDQSGNYLYYPQNRGQSFRLYAALERGKDEPVAEQDGLGRNLADYTYRITSRRGGGANEPQQAEANHMTTASAEMPATSPSPSPWAVAEAPPATVVPSTSPEVALAMPAISQPSTHPAEPPVIQPSTLPLDVRLAQGTAGEVGRPTQGATDESMPVVEPDPQAALETNPPLSSSIQPGMAVAPRRQLQFSPAPAEQPTTPQTAPATELSESPRALVDMPPLLFDSEEDLQ